VSRGELAFRCSAVTETVCHRAVHSETGQAPAARSEKASPAERAVPEPAPLREAFLWSERRKADKTALVRMRVAGHRWGRLT
jgi:putative transposase